MLERWLARSQFTKDAISLAAQNSGRSFGDLRRLSGQGPTRAVMLTPSPQRAELPVASLSMKRIDDPNPLDLPTMTHVFGKELATAERAGGGDDRAVPI
jgi:hypothetical protein